MVLQFMLEGPRTCTILCFNIPTTVVYLNKNVSIGQLLQPISKSIAVCARSRPKVLTKTSYKHNWPTPWSRYLSKVPPRILTASRFIQVSVVHSSAFVDFCLSTLRRCVFCLKMGSALTDVSVFTRRFKAMHFRPFTMKRMCFQKLHPFTVVTNDFDCVHVDDERKRRSICTLGNTDPIRLLPSFPRISYIGMCRPKGYDFLAILVDFDHHGLKSGVVFKGITRVFKRICLFQSKSIVEIEKI